MTDIRVSNEKDLFSAVYDCTTIEEAVALIKKIDALKVALDAIDGFAEKAVMYAKLEVEALIKVISLGGLDRLKGTRKKCAAWLAGLTIDERDQYIQMCDEGVTIDYIFKREYADPTNVKKQLEYIRNYRDETIAQFKEDGIIELKPFINELHKVAPVIGNDVANDIMDGMRGKLRNSGGLGVGNGSLLYVAKDSPHSQEIKNALLTRYNSVINDLASIEEIASASKIKVDYREFCDNPYTHFRSGDHICYVLLSLIKMGLFSDEQKLMDIFYRVEMDSELVEFERYMKKGRDEFIIHQYNALMKEKRNETMP